ncbi:MAG: CBS domain-containing protein [Hyphomicrobiaceae bacterium]
MQIRDVLTHKGNRVVAIWTTRVVRDALRLLEENGIASLVVTNYEGRPLGLVSDRELIGTLARHGERAFDFGVVDVMISPPPTCGPETSVQQALRKMTEQRVRHLIVQESGETRGIVSIGDLVKARLEDAETESRVLRDMARGQIFLSGEQR